MQEFNYANLLNKVPIERGMTVDIASDLLNLVTISNAQGLLFDPNAFIDTVCDTVGEEGTVLIRTFSWDFCHGKGFDINRTRSRVGALGNIALKRQDFQRTKHPIYSWMVWGKNRDVFCGLGNIESFGMDSIFAWQSEDDNSIQINLGNPDTIGLTILHFVEYKVGVTYRYVKNFTDTYVDKDGVSTKKTYSMYVRDLDHDTTIHVERYFSELESQRAKLKEEYMGVPIEFFRLKPLCQIYENDIRENGVPKSVSLGVISNK